jgi:hypothetical protein
MIKNISIAIIAASILFSGCASTSKTTSSTAASTASSVAGVLTSPAFLQSTISVAIQADEIAQPQYAPILKIVAPLVGEELVALAANPSTLPTSAALTSLLQSKLSGQNAAVVSLVLSIVSAYYPEVEAQFGSNLTAAAPYVNAIGLGLETA